MVLRADGRWGGNVVLLRFVFFVSVDLRDDCVDPPRKRDELLVFVGAVAGRLTVINQPKLLVELICSAPVAARQQGRPEDPASQVASRVLLEAARSQTNQLECRRRQAIGRDQHHCDRSGPAGRRRYETRSPPKRLDQVQWSSVRLPAMAASAPCTVHGGRPCRPAGPQLGVPRLAGCEVRHQRRSERSNTFFSELQCLNV
jgi:hypothetical protein